jgi:hypothetical protein
MKPGDERLVQEVLETRQGVKKQLMRFGMLLRHTLASANVDAITLDKLNAQLDRPVDDDPSDSGGVRLGRQRKARQQIRHDLEALKTAGRYRTSFRYSHWSNHD